MSRGWQLLPLRGLQGSLWWKGQQPQTCWHSVGYRQLGGLLLQFWHMMQQHHNNGKRPAQGPFVYNGP